MKSPRLFGRLARWRWAQVSVSAAALILSGCSTAERRAPGISNADVAFAAGMTQHHAQTMQLVNLAQVRSLPVRQWAWTDSVRRRQLSEITRLTRMLRHWDRSVPETGLQHADEGKHLRFDTTVPGVLVDDQIEALHRLRGRELAQQWLGLLITHEEGAVRIADTEVSEGADADAVGFARDDRARHAAVLVHLRALLERVNG
jgi:uncharacterized protein (DUF305 family)